MPPAPDVGRWPHLAWWLAGLAVAVSLKYHYSTATAADLDWMLRPLSGVLEVFTGHEFYRDVNGEWVSAAADVRLVKGCAGINFMIMSFLVYAWVLRPGRRVAGVTLSGFAGRLPALCIAITASWATCVLANAVRIVAAMSADDWGWRLESMGIGAAELHRYVGMGVYLPCLWAQLALADRSSPTAALAAPVLLYLLLTVLVPLLTGNAWRQPSLFFEHLASVAFAGALMCGAAFACRRAFPGRRARRGLRIKPASTSRFARAPAGPGHPIARCRSRASGAKREGGAGPKSAGRGGVAGSFAFLRRG